MTLGAALRYAEFGVSPKFWLEGEELSLAPGSALSCCPWS